MELREAINAAMEEEKPDVQTQEPAENELAASTSDNDVSDVAAGEAAAPAPDEKDAKPAVDTPPVENVPATAEETKAVHRVDRAPASWRKEAKGEWANVPLHIRQEVHKREMEITRALGEANNARQSAQQFEQAAQPYMARIQSLGVTPQQAFSELLKADYLLASGTPQAKAQLLDKLIQDYGVDIGELDAAIARRLGGQQQAAPQAFDPNQISQLVQQQLQQALAPIYQQQRQQEQQVQQQAEQTVEQMALDPKYPHFDEVRQDMADLIELATKRGVALSLDQAYSRAVGMNPELSAFNAAAQQNLAARKAKEASASVNGAPTGMNQQHTSSGNMRDDIIAAFGGGRM